VEYLGRLDFQVKIRGFRIELGEIETTLQQHASVRACVVDARAEVGSEKRLIAYVVPNEAQPTSAALRAFLMETLPEHMVPGVFVFLETLPLSSNGKVDRRALPDPMLARAERAAEYVAARTPAEQTLANIWARVLRLERVGATDNFFELGGDSLLSIQIVSQAARAGLRLTLTQVLQQPTVAAQALVAIPIAVAQRGATSAVRAGGDVALTPVQHWFAELNPPDAHHWNQAFLFTVASALDQERLSAALLHVALHHDALRLRFRRETDGTMHQRYAADASRSLVLSRVDLAAIADDDVARAIAAGSDDAQRTLDLERGPIGRAVYFDLGKNRAGRLLLLVHHLVVDGVSWRLLREDLESVYEQLTRGESAMLPASTSSFAEWSSAVSALASDAALRGEAEYWAAQTAPGTLALPLDRANGVNVEGATRLVELSLTAEETRDLLQRVPATYGTQINDALLAALSGALAGWVGAGSVVVDLEGHGREDVGVDLDLSRSVGWFTSVYPVRLTLSPGDTARARLIGVKEALRRVPRRGVGYGVLRYLTDEPSLRGGARADVLFNYLGQFDQVVAGSRLFGFAEESAGAWRSARANRRHRLEINALVQDGRLTVRFGYAETVHDAPTIEQLAARFGSALRACIAHCLAFEGVGHTSSDFALVALDQDALERVLGGDRNVNDVFPLTPLQRMFFDAGSGPADPGFQQYRFDLEGALDPDTLRESWRVVIERHDVLRARFAEESGSPVHVVANGAALQWRVEDWRDSSDVSTRLAEFLIEDRALGFDFATTPLMRVALLRTDDERWTMIWTQHHLLLDRWSWPIVLREVGAVYAALVRGATPSLAPAVPFRDYVSWLSAQDAAAAERIWREELADVEQPLRLLEAPAASSAPLSTDEIQIRLSVEETSALRSAARARRLTTNLLVQGAWAAALAHLGGREEAIFGLAVDGRGADVPGVSEIVGVLINNVPVRVRLDGGATIEKWLVDLQRRQAIRRAADHASLESIQRWSGVSWRHRLFESLLVFQDESAEAGARDWLGDSVVVREMITPTETAYPITALVTGGDRLSVSVVGDRRQVPRALLEQLAAAVNVALRTMASDLGSSMEALRAALPTVHAFGSDAATQNAVGEHVEPRTATEWVVARIWSELLGVERVGVTDNFFARGGHSLLATQIVSRMRDTFHVEVPVRTLFEGPSVAALALALAALERKPGQVERIAEVVQRIEGMSAEELRQSAAAHDARARQTVMVNGN
jgi:non-ribosomal peptide synthase protein (TIGR01720 family)